MDKYPEYPFGADLPPVEKRMVRPVIPENTLPLRSYLHTQSRYAALPPVGTRIGQTIGNRIHFGPNAITCQYTSLDNVPQPRYSGIHRRRNYCQKLDIAVMYFDVEVIKRGYYRATIREIELDPRTRPDFEITDRYIGLMEQTILRAPEYWLWTHNRWKHQHL